MTPPEVTTPEARERLARYTVSFLQLRGTPPQAGMAPLLITYPQHGGFSMVRELPLDIVDDLHGRGKREIQRHVTQDQAHSAVLVAEVGRVVLEGVEPEHVEEVIGQIRAGHFDLDELTEDALSVLVQDAGGCGELSRPLHEDGDWSYCDFGAQGWSTTLRLEFPAGEGGAET